MPSSCLLKQRWAWLWPSQPTKQDSAFIPKLLPPTMSDTRRIQVPRAIMDSINENKPMCLIDQMHRGSCKKSHKCPQRHQGHPDADRRVPFVSFNQGRAGLVVTIRPPFDDAWGLLFDHKKVGRRVLRLHQPVQYRGAKYLYIYVCTYICIYIYIYIWSPRYSKGADRHPKPREPKGGQSDEKESPLGAQCVPKGNTMVTQW